MAAHRVKRALRRCLRGRKRGGTGIPDIQTRSGIPTHAPRESLGYRGPHHCHRRGASGALALLPRVRAGMHCGGLEPAGRRHLVVGAVRVARLSALVCGRACTVPAWSPRGADPLLWMLSDPRRLAVTRLDGFLWLRLNDVAAALKERGYGAFGTIGLDVANSLA